MCSPWSLPLSVLVNNRFTHMHQTGKAAVAFSISTSVQFQSRLCTPACDEYLKKKASTGASGRGNWLATIGNGGWSWIWSGLPARHNCLGSPGDSRTLQVTSEAILRISTGLPWLHDIVSCCEGGEKNPPGIASVRVGNLSHSALSQTWTSKWRSQDSMLLHACPAGTSIAILKDMLWKSLSSWTLLIIAHWHIILTSQTLLHAYSLIRVKGHTGFSFVEIFLMVWVIFLKTQSSCWSSYSWTVVVTHFSLFWLFF